MGDVIASAAMLIRKPREEVFNAFVNPRTIEKFWLKSASGPLAQDATVEWQFMVQDARETVTVTEFVPPEIIVFKWSDGIAVKITFKQLDTHATVFSVEATGFHGDNAPALAINATEGFTIVACDLKSFLETGQSGNMVRDKAALISADRAEA